MRSAELVFQVRCPPEYDAGIVAGNAEVVIRIDGHLPFDGDQEEFWRKCISEFFDGAKVLNQSEIENELREEERWLSHLNDGVIE